MLDAHNGSTPASIDPQHHQPPQQPQVLLEHMNGVIGHQHAHLQPQLLNPAMMEQYFGLSTALGAGITAGGTDTSSDGSEESKLAAHLHHQGQHHQQQAAASIHSPASSSNSQSHSAGGPSSGGSVGMVSGGLNDLMLSTAHHHSIVNGVSQNQSLLLQQQQQHHPQHAQQHGDYSSMMIGMNNGMGAMKEKKPQPVDDRVKRPMK